MLLSPAGSAGTDVQLTVTTAGGTSATSSSDRFAYLGATTSYIVDQHRRLRARER